MSATSPTRTNMTLGRDDLDRVRQWFDAVQDVSPAYLEPGDFELARGIYDKLGMRVPLSVLRGLA